MISPGHRVKTASQTEPLVFVLRSIFPLFKDLFISSKLSGSAVLTIILGLSFSKLKAMPDANPPPPAQTITSASFMPFLLDCLEISIPTDPCPAMT